MNRIRRALLCFAFIAATASANAQVHYDANIAVGIKGGMSLSRVFFHPSVEQGFLPGAQIGAQFRYIEENHFGLIAELNFEQRGWKENFDGAPYHYSRTLNYIQLPVMAHIYFGHRGRFFVNAGPAIGVYLGEKTSTNFDPNNTSGLPDFPNTNRMNTQMTMKAEGKFDYGIAAGIGGEFFATQQHSVTAEVRFYYGLGNVFSAKRPAVFSASNSMSLFFTLGYWFRLK